MLVCPLYNITFKVLYSTFKAYYQLYLNNFALQCNVWNNFWQITFTMFLESTQQVFILMFTFFSYQLSTAKNAPPSLYTFGQSYWNAISPLMRDCWGWSGVWRMGWSPPWWWSPHWLCPIWSPSRPGAGGRGSGWSAQSWCPGCWSCCLASLGLAGQNQCFLFLSLFIQQECQSQLYCN